MNKELFVDWHQRLVIRGMLQRGIAVLQDMHLWPSKNLRFVSKPIFLMIIYEIQLKFCIYNKGF
jgi:hypothetical protein